MPSRKRSSVGRVASLMFAASLWALSGCGGDDDGGDGQIPAVDAATGSFTITNEDESGHSHELIFECADLAAGSALTIIATGPHTHTVMLTPAQLAMIAAGETVTISFTDGHSHTFVIVKPADAC